MLENIQTPSPLNESVILFFLATYKQVHYFVLGVINWTNLGFSKNTSSFVVVLQLLPCEIDKRIYIKQSAFH